MDGRVRPGCSFMATDGLVTTNWSIKLLVFYDFQMVLLLTCTLTDALLKLPAS